MSRVSSLFSCKKHNIFSQKNENIPKNFDASSASVNIYGFNTAFLWNRSASRHARNYRAVCGFIAAQRRVSRRYFRKVFNTDKSFLNRSWGERFLTRNLARTPPFSCFWAPPFQPFWSQADPPRFLHYFSKTRAKFGKKPLFFILFRFLRR